MTWAPPNRLNHQSGWFLAKKVCKSLWFQSLSSSRSTYSMYLKKHCIFQDRGLSKYSTYILYKAGRLKARLNCLCTFYPFPSFITVKNDAIHWFCFCLLLWNDFVQCNVYIEAYKLLHRSVQKIQVLDFFHDDTAKQHRNKVNVLFLYLYI